MCWIQFDTVVYLEIPFLKTLFVFYSLLLTWSLRLAKCGLNSTETMPRLKFDLQCRQIRTM